MNPTETNKPVLRNPTSQEVFDFVARHLLTQRSKSKEAGKCLYRGPNGTKCAVGCLIPDWAYNQNMECQSVFSEDVLPILYKLGLKEHAWLLEKLQKAHDDVNLLDWPHRLKQIALSRNLSNQVVLQLEDDYLRAVKEPLVCTQ